MDFSECYKQSSGLVSWSPDGKLLASASQYRLVVRDAESLQIQHIWTCLDQIQQVEWSHDSKYILCALFKRDLMQVWSLDQRDWTCKINEGPAGLVAARWAPDSRHILSSAAFQLRITIWSLVSRSAKYIKYPKYDSHGMCFSHDGRYLAIAERKDCKDVVSLFATEQWEMVKQFQVETKDLADIAWAPDDNSLIIWDTPLDFRLLHIGLDGRTLSRYQVDDSGLGIKTVKWSPNADFVAVGCYDERLRVIYKPTWKCIAELSHSSILSATGSGACYREVEHTVAEADGSPAVTRAKYVISSENLKLPIIESDPEKPNPSMGIGVLEWSACGTYVAAMSDSMPTALFLWDITKLSLVAVLVQMLPVKDVCWSQDVERPRLALCTGNNRLYLWAPLGCSVVDSPTPDLVIQNLSWRADGGAVLLSEKNRYCVAYLVDDVAGPPAVQSDQEE